MKTFRNSILIGITAFGLASTVLAADQASAGTPAVQHAHPGFMGKVGAFADGKFAEHMQARMEKKLSDLHDKLKLLPVQEPAWTTFTATLKPAPRPDAATRAQMRADFEKLTAPEKGDFMLTKMKLHETMMSTKLEALKTFYASLTADQQKIFNANFKGPHDGHGPRHHGGEHVGHGN